MLKRIIRLFLIVSTLLSLSSAELIFQNWHQKVKLKPQTKTVVINCALEARLSHNQYYTSWSYIFDRSEQVKILEVKANNKITNYEFRNNELKIYFDNLKNRQIVAITIKYKTKDNNNNPYFIQQYASLPQWLRGARGSLEVSLPADHDICAYPKDFQAGETTFLWAGTIPDEGISGHFKYTPKYARWQIEKTYDISGNGTHRGFDLYIPVCFKTGTSHTISYKIITSPRKIKSTVSNNYHLFKCQQISAPIISISALIETGKKITDFNPGNKNSFLEPQPKYNELLKKLVKNILRKSSKLPTHIRLANWVHSYLTYDYGYTGQKMSIQDILSKRRGVCEHYSQLYIQLCRAAGIPALEINGQAYSKGSSSFVDGWGPHSWTLVNIKNKWIPVDPTWLLTTGTMPVSHIAFHYQHTNPYSYMLKNYYGKIFVKEKDISIKEIIK